MKQKQARTLNQQMKTRLTAGLQIQYELLGMNVFKWEGLPDVIPKRYPERWLYENGMCTFFEHPTIGFMCLPVATQSIQKNVYGEPSSWSPVAVGEYSGKINSMKLNSTNSVLMRNDTMYKPCKPFVDMMIEQMVNVEMTMRLNINAQKNPMWFNSNQETALQNKNTFIEYYEVEPVFYKDAFQKDEFEIINNNIKYIGKELSDTYNIYDARILTYLGVNNTKQDKMERVLEAEAESNNESLNYIFKSREEMRKINAEEINTLFGLSCKVSKNVDDGAMQGTQDNGGEDNESGEDDTEDK